MKFAHEYTSGLIVIQHFTHANRIQMLCLRYIVAQAKPLKWKQGYLTSTRSSNSINRCSMEIFSTKMTADQIVCAFFTRFWFLFHVEREWLTLPGTSCSHSKKQRWLMTSHFMNNYRIKFPLKMVAMAISSIFGIRRDNMIWRLAHYFFPLRFRAKMNFSFRKKMNVGITYAIHNHTSK